MRRLPSQALHLALLALPLAPRAQAVLAEWKGGRVTEAEWNDLAAETTLENGVDARQVRGPQAQDLRYRIVRTWAEARILADAAAKAGVTVTQADLDADWAAFVKGSGGEARAAQRLKTAEIAKEKLLAQRRIFQLARRYLDRVAPPAPVSEADAKALYDRVKRDHPETFRLPERWAVAHIEIGTAPGMSDAEAAALKARAGAARAEAAKPGADFAAVAKKYSTDLSTRDQGGRLPPYSRELLLKLPAPFGATALALKPGELSPVIRTASGFHVIRGGEKLPAGEIGFSEAKPRLVEMVRERKRMELAQDQVSARLKDAGLEMKIAPAPPPAGAPKPAAGAPRPPAP